MNEYTIEADRLYTKGESTLYNGQQEDRMRVALEISDFLGAFGEILDQSGGSETVDKLGAMVDRLTSNLQPRKDSPILTGVKSFINDDTSFDNAVEKNLNDLKNKILPKPPPGGWNAWLIGGGILATIIGVGYTVRAFK